MTQIPETCYTKNEDGAHIAYQVIGEGPLDLVYTTTWSHIDARWENREWADYLRRLASFSRLIQFDKRGSGASDPLPPDSWTPEQWMDDLRVVMDAADSEGAALLGHGDGGVMASLFAATYPERMSALILATTCARSVRAEDYPWGLDPDLVDTLARRREETWGTDETAELSMAGAPKDPEFRRWWAKYQRMGASPAIAGAHFRVYADIDIRHVLPLIQSPTLVLAKIPTNPSDEGGRYDVGHARFLADHIDNARLVTLADDEVFFFRGDVGAVVDTIQEFLTGARPVVTDRVLATVLFADIVDSTGQATRLGDRRWLSVLDQHDRLFDTQIEQFRGRKIKTTGDGVVATFDGPARAIHCGCAIRDGAQNLGTEIRVGAHAGEVEVRGEDIGGIAVHLAQRVQSLANPNEVLVSRTVVDLVAGSGIRFDDRGEYELKGVPGNWKLYAVSG